MCINTCLHVFLCTVRMQCPWRPEDSVGSPGTGVTGSCEPPCKMLGTEPRSSARAVSALTHQPSLLSPTYPKVLFTLLLVPYTVLREHRRVQSFLGLSREHRQLFVSESCFMCVPPLSAYMPMCYLCVLPLLSRREVSAPQEQLQGVMSCHARTGRPLCKCCQCY